MSPKGDNLLSGRSAAESKEIKNSIHDLQGLKPDLVRISLVKAGYRPPTGQTEARQRPENLKNEPSPIGITATKYYELLLTRKCVLGMF